MKKNPHIVIHTLLLIGCLLVLTATETMVRVKAQVGCSQPPLLEAYIRYSWAPNKTVTVKIDDAWNSTERQAFASGIAKWNDWKSSNCSNVTHSGFEAQHFADRNNVVPPDDTAYWLKKDPGNGYGGGTKYYLIGIPERIRAVRVEIVPTATNNDSYDYFNYLGTHETGHTFGLGNCDGCPNGTSVMGGQSNTDASFNAGGPTSCDNDAVKLVYCPTPTPTPTPCRPSSWELKECRAAEGFWNSQNCDCDPRYCVPTPANPCDLSPILVDVEGNGVALTNALDGVDFDLNPGGVVEHIAWTAANSDDAWLTLERNGNGLIDSGVELFGNFTPQPAPPAGIVKNGFNALSVYDLTINGGNADGKISGQDAIFAQLRLWQDSNHNGVSESTELFTLTALGVVSLDLDYKESKRVDEHGNRFLYRAKVRDARGADVGKRAWDVFLVRPR